MADKQTEADKLAAMREYRAQQDAAVDRIAALKAARLARDAAAAQAQANATGQKKPAARKVAGKSKR